MFPITRIFTPFSVSFSFSFSICENFSRAMDSSVSTSSGDRLKFSMLKA
jgi:hypothetical protein